MSLGFVVGESKPTSVTAITSRSLSVGEYIKISIDEGEILGLVERSSVSSAAFTDVRNFHEAEESTEIADINIHFCFILVFHEIAKQNQEKPETLDFT